MAKVRVRASKEAVDKQGEDRGEFVLPKPGYYILQVQECEPGFTKDKDGDPDESKPYLKFTYKIVGVGLDEAKVTENYGNVWDYMSFSPESDWKRVEVALAFGVASYDSDGNLDTEFDTDEMVERKVTARLKTQKGRTKDESGTAKIARLVAYGTDPAADGAVVAVDYGTAELPLAADAMGGATFGDGDGAEDAPAEPPVTREELEAADGPYPTLKDLGVLASEFGLDPKDSIVKNAAGKVDQAATRAAIIDAILLEQDGPGGVDADATDDTDGDGDDEEPF